MSRRNIERETHAENEKLNVSVKGRPPGPFTAITPLSKCICSIEVTNFRSISIALLSSDSRAALDRHDLQSFLIRFNVLKPLLQVAVDIGRMSMISDRPSTSLL